MSKKIYLLNGPNLNMLGTRQRDIYGDETLADIEVMSREACDDGFELVAKQSNHEGELVEWIHAAREDAVGIVINGGAYTHTSIALLDALNMFEGPVMEVHISNVFRREPFRHHSYITPAADAVIAGLGTHGYIAAVRRICAVVGK